MIVVYLFILAIDCCAIVIVAVEINMTLSLSMSTSALAIVNSPIAPPLPPPRPAPPQIDFDSRKKYDVLNDCLMTINGTDFCIPQKGVAKKGNAFASHKYAGKSALRYELGVSILGGDLG